MGEAVTSDSGTVPESREDAWTDEAQARDHAEETDAHLPDDRPEDADGADVPDTDGADADCPMCGYVCETRVATCGHYCCSYYFEPGMTWRDWPSWCQWPDFGEEVLVHGDYRGYARLQFLRSPILVEDPAAAELRPIVGWTFVADGSELVVYAQWVDCWGYATDGPPHEEPDTSLCRRAVGCCAHHCWVDMTTMAWVVDRYRGILLHAETIPWDSWEIGVDEGMEGCAIAEAAFCIDIAGEDRSYFLGTDLTSSAQFRGAWWLGSPFYPGITYTDSHLFELPVLRGAVHVYRTSTQEHLASVDLLLLQPGQSWP